MTTSYAADACVVGGGLAGLSAALRAAEEGLRVLVLERLSEAEYVCNSRLTGGAFHICLRDIQSSEADLEKAIREATRGAAHAELARAVAQDGKRAVRWLQGKGIRFIKGGAEPHHNFVLSPPSLQRFGADWRGRGGDVLLRTLEAALLKAGGKILRGHRATELVAAQGVCSGVRGKTAAGEFVVSAPSVVIADGGFQCDPELVKAHISPAPEKLLQRNARSGLGDGVRMAMAAGAALSPMMGFYGHLQSRDALKNEKLWPLPWLDNVATAAIAVDREGRRFADEGRGGVFLANAVAALLVKRNK